MKLRPLTLQDLDASIALERTMPDSKTWEPDTKEHQQPLVQAGNVFGIFDDQKLIGKVGFIDEGEKGWQVDGFIIDQHCRGKKFGSMLLDYATKEITHKSPKTIFLYVYPKNSPAIMLYLKHGFIIHEYIPNKYGPGKDRLKMIQSTP